MSVATPGLQGFVLAAGFGQRMLPITQTVPKPLLPVGNLPLVGYALKLLHHHGIDDIFVNLHHLGGAVREALGNGAAYDVRLRYSEEPEILGTGGALKRVHEQLHGTTVVVNSDTLIDVDLTAAVAEHRARGALCTMVLREAPAARSYGRIDIDADGRIVRLLGEGEGEAPGPVRSLMFTGVQIIEPRFLETIAPGIYSCVIRQGYKKALAHHEPLYGHISDGFWADAGTPADYLAVNMAALAQALPLRHADPLAGFAHAPRRAVAEVVRMGHGVELGSDTRLMPPVLLGDGVRVGEHAQLGPHTIVGAQVHIGRGAQARQTIVLDSARIEPNARLERVLVGRHATLHLDG